LVVVGGLGVFGGNARSLKETTLREMNAMIVQATQTTASSGKGKFFSVRRRIGSNATEQNGGKKKVAKRDPPRDISEASEERPHQRRRERGEKPTCYRTLGRYRKKVTLATDWGGKKGIGQEAHSPKNARPTAPCSKPFLRRGLKKRRNADFRPLCTTKLGGGGEKAKRARLGSTLKISACPGASGASFLWGGPLYPGSLQIQFSEELDVKCGRGNKAHIEGMSHQD